MPRVQQLDLLNAVAIETGTVRFGADPPGLYVRGDLARLLAIDLRVVLNFVCCKQKGIASPPIRSLRVAHLVRLAPCRGTGISPSSDIEPSE